MKLISWNCRGLGRPSIARALRKIVKTIDLVGILLMVSKIDDVFVSRVMNKIWFSYFFQYLRLVVEEVLSFVGVLGFVLRSFGNLEYPSFGSGS